MCQLTFALSSQPLHFNIGIVRRLNCIVLGSHKLKKDDKGKSKLVIESSFSTTEPAFNLVITTNVRAQAQQLKSTTRLAARVPFCNMRSEPGTRRFSRVHTGVDEMVRRVELPSPSWSGSILIIG